MIRRRRWLGSFFGASLAGGKAKDFAELLEKGLALWHRVVLASGVELE